MAGFGPQSRTHPNSRRSSVVPDIIEHSFVPSRSISIESIGSSNSVPFVPLPPPQPPVWKRFKQNFTQRVIKRHIKFMIAMYISSILIMIPQIGSHLGPLPHLSNIAVVFMHPARTVGSQLEVTIFSYIGGIVGAIWLMPCQLAVVAFNQKYLLQGNHSAWMIEAAWFFIGIWFMTTLKARYAKLNCTFIIFTIASIYGITRTNSSIKFNVFDFINIMGPLMTGVTICLLVSIVFWPETASEGLGRALNESLDTSRALLNLSTRSFLLNHKTIALPKCTIEKAQAEVRVAQKKLYSAYREARFEVTYSMTDPADYKDVRVIVSALMRHLGSLSLVVQNERLLMLGHPDRVDDDLYSEPASESDSSDTDSSDSSSGSEESVGNSTPGTGVSDSKGSKQHPHLETSRKRSSAAEVRRVRQLLMRAEFSAQDAIKARQHHQEESRKKNAFGRSGLATAPPSPGGRQNLSTLNRHTSGRPGDPSSPLSATYHRRSLLSATPSMGSPVSASHEDHHYGTVRSLKSLFSVMSKPKFKANRPQSFSGSSSSERHRYSFSDRDRGAARDSPNRNRFSFNGGTLTELQVERAAMAYRKKQERAIKKEKRQAQRAAKAEKERIAKQEQAEAAARAIPPKEVAFGDRRLFMTFLDTVRDPLQRLSDSCARVMTAMERELVSGLNVEKDRLERIKRRNARKASALLAAEISAARLKEQEAARKAEANGTSAENLAQHGRGVGPAGWDRVRLAMGIKPHVLPENGAGMADVVKETVERERQSKLIQGGTSTESVYPKRLECAPSLIRGIDSDEDGIAALPPDLSVVEFLNQELEIFDKAEAAGVQEFIASQPTLDVGPREEIFLIFFFLFALREIARELLRLGKHLEELEEKQWAQMEAEGRKKRRKKLWWPKVIGNFWTWVSWGNYSQVKTSEGYNSLIMNTTKNIEKKQPRLVRDEKVRVEAKAARAAAKASKAQQVAQAVADKEEERIRTRLQRHRASEMWDPPPLRRSATIAALFHRERHTGDTERGQGVHLPARHFSLDQHKHQEADPNTATSISRTIHSGDRTLHDSPIPNTDKPTWKGVHPFSPDIAGDGPTSGEPSTKPDWADLSQTQAAGSASNTKPYPVARIPKYSSLQKQAVCKERGVPSQSSTLSPKVKVLHRNETAPPELDTKPYLPPSKFSLLRGEDGSKSDSTLKGTLFKRSRFEDLEARREETVQDRTARQFSASPQILTPRALLPSTESDVSDDSECDDSSLGEKIRQDQSWTKTQRAPASVSRHDQVDAAARQNPGAIQQGTNLPEQQGQRLQEEAPRTVFINVPKPKTLRYRIWEWLQPFKSDEVKFGLKMAGALSLIGMWSWLGWYNRALATDRGQWAMMTIMAVLSPTMGATFSVCAMRIGGTLAGSFWAMLTYLALPGNPYVVCVMMLPMVFAVAFLMLQSTHPLMGIIMMLSYSSVTIIMYLGRSSETIYEICYKRAASSIVGILISVLVNSLIWPILARRELRREIALLIGRQGVLFAEIINKFLLEEQDTKACEKFLNQGQMEEAAGEKAGLLVSNFAYDKNTQPGPTGKEAAAGVGSGGGIGTSAAITAASLASGGKTSSGSAFDPTATQFRNTVDATDPDRLAFQHVEHQLQTKIIKITQLLELSASEPRLKEKFPLKLYQQIVQCCQNILDRMVSMRMAAQLLSPEVRNLVTGPMNYYRRDMVGALLLYFSVLSSSLASKTCLPPYLPSARMARLRVIYNVRDAIAARQAETHENHYTYMYYYAFSSALEEVIEELELLAILIKPLVGITLVASVDAYGYGVGAGYQSGLDNTTNGQHLPEGVSVVPGLPESGGGFAGLNASITGNAFGQAPLQMPSEQLFQNVHPDLVFQTPPKVATSVLSGFQSTQNSQLGNVSPFVDSSTSGTSQSMTGQKRANEAQNGLRIVTSMGYRPSPSTVDSPLMGETRRVLPSGLVLRSPPPVASPVLTSPVVMMDQNLIGNRHAQRYKEAILAAQEASGQQVVEVASPVLAPGSSPRSFSRGEAAFSPRQGVTPSRTDSGLSSLRLGEDATGGSSGSLRKRIGNRIVGSSHLIREVLGGGNGHGRVQQVGGNESPIHEIQEMEEKDLVVSPPRSHDSSRRKAALSVQDLLDPDADLASSSSRKDSEKEKGADL